MLSFFFTFCLICKISSEIQRIEVKNFCDYSVQMQNTGDQLEIYVPPKTLFFISSANGYIVSAGGTVNDLQPDPMKRLIYYQYNGQIIVTSTMDNLNFCFHTLVLTKIQEPYDHIFITSNPYDFFLIIHREGTNDFTNCTYNATFANNHLVWFLGDYRIKCDINTRMYEPYLNAWDKYSGKAFYPTFYAFPFLDQTNYSDIKFNVINLFDAKKVTLTSKSKLIYIKKVKDLYIHYESFFKMYCEPENKTDDYYIDYRVYVNASNLIKNKLITRGEERYDKLQEIRSSGGVINIDFSIYKNYFLYQYVPILIFPKITEMSTNILFNDNITFMYVNQQEVSFKSGTDYVAETDINVPIIFVIVFPRKVYDRYFILSTCPTEKLIIGPSSQNKVNYTNDHIYLYVMGSLQDIQTSITFEGSVTIATFDGSSLINKTSFNSGETIDGIFVAYIDKDAKCTFETTPNGELKEGYYDDARTMFKEPQNITQNLLISPKYGDYYNITVDYRNESVSFKDRDFQIVSTFNTVYVQNQKGWSAEVLYPKLEENVKIGPNYGITSFYFSQVPFCGLLNRRIVVKFNKENTDDDFELKIRTTSIEKFNFEYVPSNCDRLIMFNKIPSKYSFNFKQSNKYRQIDINSGEKVCIFPLVSDFYVGKTYDNYRVYSAYGKHIYSLHGDIIYNYDYSSNFSAYHYYQSDTYPILVYDGFTYKENMAFLNVPSNNYYDDPKDLLPDEPKFFINTKIDSSYGVHPISPNQYVEIENGDDEKDEIKSDDENGDSGDSGSDDDNDEKDVYVDLDYVTSYEVVNMAKIESYTIRIARYALLIIHSNQNYDAEVFIFDSNKRVSIGKIKSNSDEKLIYYGKKNGFIRVTKSKTSAKILGDYDDSFIYSYVDLNRVNSLDSFKCDHILVSTNPKTYVALTCSQTNESMNFNYTLSNKQNLCLWFPFPIRTTINSNFNLPHNQYVVVDKEQYETEYSKETYTGKSFLYILKNTTLVRNNTNATYNAEPYSISEYSKVSDFYQFDKIFYLANNYGIVSKYPEVSEKGKGDDTKKGNIIGISCSVVAIVALIVIIVAVAVWMKKNKNQVSNEENDDQNQNDSQSKINQNQPDQTQMNQTQYNQNQPYQYQQYPNQPYPYQQNANQPYPYQQNANQPYPYQQNLNPNQYYPNQNYQNQTSINQPKKVHSNQNQFDQSENNLNQNSINKVDQNNDQETP